VVVGSVLVVAGSGEQRVDLASARRRCGSGERWCGAWMGSAGPWVGSLGISISFSFFVVFLFD
jgi:hypothetical protein